MKITKYLNTTQKEVESRRHNIWLGISLGNKYFSQANIEEYIRWSLDRTKNKVLIVIADAIQAFNLEVLDGMNPEAAHRRALKLGDVKYAEIEEIMEKLTAEEKDKIHLVRWGNVTDTSEYKNKLNIVLDYYRQSEKFRNHVIEIVRAGRKDRASRIERLSEKELDRLAEYILNELPHFVDGIQGYNEYIYTLIPYPKLTMLDKLFIGLNNRTMFPELAEKLNIENEIAIVEAFVD